MAMGSPFSLSRSVSLGIVSNTERVFPGGFGGPEGGELELEAGQRTGLFTRWIQHDALISPGNSGGPLVNLGGEVVGVNELGGGNLSFAIPSNLAARIGRQLIDKGEVERSFLGVAFQPLGSDEDSPKAAQARPAGCASPRSRWTARRPRPGCCRATSCWRSTAARWSAGCRKTCPLAAGRPGRPAGGLEARPQGAARRPGGRARGEDGAAREGPRRSRPASTTGASPPRRSPPRWPATCGSPASQERAGHRGAAGRAGADRRAADPGGRRLARGGRPENRLAGRPGGRLPGSCTKAGAKAHERLLFRFERLGNEQLTLLKPRADDQEDPPRELPRAWVGVATQPLLAELAEELGMAGRRGFRITRVYAGSEALKAGLAVGDVILAIDGDKLEPNALEDAALLVARGAQPQHRRPGRGLTLRRGQATLDLPLVLERTRLTKEEARRHTDRDFEISVRELTFFDRDENRWPEDLQGVVVENVDGVGWAGLAGLRPEDLIVEIDGEKMTGLAAFRSAMKRISAAKPEKVEVLVRRGARTYFHRLEPDWAPDAQEKQEKQPEKQGKGT